MAYKDYCFNCSHGRSDHFASGAWCRVCDPDVKTVAEMQAKGDLKCPGFEPSQMCGVCGSRIAWVGSPEGYIHANQEEDDHHAEPRHRRRRVQRV